MSEPTARPWEIKKNSHTRIVGIRAGAHWYPMFRDGEFSFEKDSHKIHWANAAHIVKCVNSYEPLLEAAKAYLRYMKPIEVCGVLTCGFCGRTIEPPGVRCFSDDCPGEEIRAAIQAAESDE